MHLVRSKAIAHLYWFIAWIAIFFIAWIAVGIFFHKQKHPPELRCKRGVLKNFANFIGKHLCQSFFFNKVAGLSLLKRDTNCFPANIAKFLRAPILKNICERLLLLILKVLQGSVKKVCGKGIGSVYPIWARN